MVPVPWEKSASKISPDIAWSNLNFTAGKANILTQCWGRVNSGQVAAIMGPSGAGKSSLLNVLAGRSSSGGNVNIEGKITVGGKQIDPVAFRKNIAYVMQDDALMATATPREALIFSANMRLPSDLSREHITSLVDHLLEDLGLTVCADVMIGGALIKGISGGQRKRTSVGVELITNPILLFLDEPTSGLDSFSAFSLINLLKQVALKDCTILCTIHQPSSEVFFLFDVVIFMKNGYIFYQGSPMNIVPFFSKLDYPCPANYNPSDFVMSLCQSIPFGECQEKGILQTSPPATMLADGSISANAAGLAEQPSSMKLESTMVFTSNSSFLKQLSWLAHRELVNTQRDVFALVGRYGSTFILSLLFGLIFLNVGKQDNGNTNDFNNHFGGIVMILISSMFGTAQPVMLAFPYERPIFLREYTTGTYGAIAYFLSKLLIEIPLTFLQTLEQFILCYFMLGLRGNFIFIVLASYGLGMCSNSVAVMIGCMVNDVKQVNELAPLLFVPQMLFVGFFIRTSLIPVFLRWAQYLCALKYAINLIILTEFSLSAPSCNTSEAAHENCASLISSNQIDESKYYSYILIIFALFVVFRVVGVIILIKKAQKFY